MLRFSRNVFLSLLSALGFAVVARAELRVGDRFPPLAGLAGVTPAPVLSRSVTVVDFCASWCAPCRDSIPALGAIQREFRDRGVLVLGVSIDERAAGYQSLLKKWAPAFAVAHDADQKLVAQVGVPTVPTTYILDRDGIVRAIHVGFHPSTPAALRVDLQKLLTP